MQINIVWLMLFLLQATPSSQCQGVPKGFLLTPRAAWVGLYSNEAYGYSVIIPKGLTGYSAPEGSPQHGFGIILGNKPGNYLFVNGEANALEFRTAAEAAKKSLEYLGKDAVKIEASVLTRSRLGALPAVDLVVRYTCGPGDAKYVSTSTFALSPDRDRETVFELTFYAQASEFARYRGVFDQIRESWRYIGRK